MIENKDDDDSQDNGEKHSFDEIYSNIINYDLKIEKEISKNCEDLIKSKNSFMINSYFLTF